MGHSAARWIWTGPDLADSCFMFMLYSYYVSKRKKERKKMSVELKFRLGLSLFPLLCNLLSSETVPVCFVSEAANSVTVFSCAGCAKRQLNIDGATDLGSWLAERLCAELKSHPFRGNT